MTRPAACIRTWASVVMASARSASFIPSTLHGSNIRLICLPNVRTGASCCFIDFLPCDSIIARGVCGSSSPRDQPLEIQQRRKINLRLANSHIGADERIHYPSWNRDNDARRSLHLEKLTSGSLLYSPYDNRPTEMRVPAVVYFQLLSDMGRMNGRLESEERTGYLPVPTPAPKRSPAP